MCENCRSYGADRFVDESQEDRERRNAEVTAQEMRRERKLVLIRHARRVLSELNGLYPDTQMCHAANAQWHIEQLYQLELPCNTPLTCPDTTSPTTDE